MVTILAVGYAVFAIQSIPTTVHLSTNAKIYFKNWYNQNRSCSITSKKCEAYFETVHHLSCYLVYGDKNDGTGNWAAHMWTIVVIDGVPHEFESTTLFFKEVSEEYHIQSMQEGFYVDGVKYAKSQKLDNWRGLNEG